MSVELYKHNKEAYEQVEEHLKLVIKHVLFILLEQVNLLYH